MIEDLWNQLSAIVNLELGKTFFSRRALWIYLLALVPPALFFGNSIYARSRQVRLAAIAAQHPLSKQTLRSIRAGVSMDQVVARLGQPYQRFTRKFWLGNPPQLHDRSVYFYTDGETDFAMSFNDGTLLNVGRRGGQDLPQLLLVFASVFQLYFIRLAIFFGCAAIFTNLFRGELLDKSLHFYLLTPVPRPVLAVGKYLAALFATSVIFAASAGLQFYGVLRGFESATVHDYLQKDGLNQILAYMSIAVLACVAYGSIFMAAGLLARNPTVPVALLLLWESVNAFLPGTLKMFSVVFYLQSLTPIEPPPDTSVPPLFRALIAPPERVDTFTAVAVIAAVTIVVLTLSSFRANELEINYSAD
jgi:ABC-type transport system involved in multi-copper enzyme maturation permease subunit